MFDRALLLIMASIVSVLGCATTTPKDYTDFRNSDPRSVLIVPVVNNTVNVDAADYFLTTIPMPVAERGYYVFPIHAVKRTMEDEGLADANMVHDHDPTRLAELFGADSVLYITIHKWESKYVVIKTVVTVTFAYRLVDGENGNLLWDWQETMQYSSSSSASGDLVVSLIADAVSAAITRAAPNYMPLARQANQNAVNRNGYGLPAGKYHPKYMDDLEAFPIAEQGE